MSKTDGVFTLGHSPDPDDAFMFYALAENKIDHRGWRFEHLLQDIQTLNERATRGELHISAISIHAYAYVLDKYALLPAARAWATATARCWSRANGAGRWPTTLQRQRLAEETRSPSPAR